ncbi:low temperature requirement protein A [Micromonospora sp. NPDC050980]|uniref:low temperature requirement protein A n=1 Tax=Micromonospora sp. NPDC050980 TaxID=3155161 RepID=UPI0033C00F84
MGRDGVRRHPAWPRPPGPAAEDRRVTPFEIFFDLVFVFALTRIMALAGPHPTPVGMTQGLLLLCSGSPGRRTPGWATRRGPTSVWCAAGSWSRWRRCSWPRWSRRGAWTSGPGLDGPLLVVLAYALLRAVHLALFHWAAADDAALRARIRFFALISVVGWLTLLLGAARRGAASGPGAGGAGRTAAGRRRSGPARWAAPGG